MNTISPPQDICRKIAVNRITRKLRNRERAFLNADTPERREHIGQTIQRYKQLLTYISQ